MRLPINFHGAWRLTARSLIYVVSWIGPSARLPLPVAQIVFPFEKASRLISLLEVGKIGLQGGKIGGKILIKEFVKEANRPVPSAKDRKLKAFKSKMNHRVQRGNIAVSCDELINSGAIGFEILHDSFVVEQLENGNYQFTVTWIVPEPPYYPINTSQNTSGTVFMDVQGFPPSGISVTESFQISALDFHEFCVSLAQEAGAKVKAQLTDRICTGITPKEFQKRFDHDPDNGGKYFANNVGVNRILHHSSKRTSSFISKEKQTNTLVEPKGNFTWNKKKSFSYTIRLVSLFGLTVFIIQIIRKLILNKANKQKKNY